MGRKAAPKPAVEAKSTAFFGPQQSYFDREVFKSIPRRRPCMFCGRHLATASRFKSQKRPGITVFCQGCRTRTFFCDEEPAIIAEAYTRMLENPESAAVLQQSLLLLAEQIRIEVADGD